MILFSTSSEWYSPPRTAFYSRRYATPCQVRLRYVQWSCTRNRSSTKGLPFASILSAFFLLKAHALRNGNCGQEQSIRYVFLTSFLQDPSRCHRLKRLDVVIGRTARKVFPLFILRQLLLLTCIASSAINSQRSLALCRLLVLWYFNVGLKRTGIEPGSFVFFLGEYWAE